MKTSSEKKDKSIFLALLFFIGAGVLVFLSMAPSKPGKKSVLAQQKRHEQNVNKHLMMTSDKAEMARQRMQLENQNMARDLSSTHVQPTYSPSQQGLDLSTDPRGYEIANELGRGAKQESQFLTPDEEVQRDLFTAQQNAEYTKAYKEEYARQFIENARKGGWQVELNDDFKVISVKPLRKPSQSLQLFDSSNSGDLLR